MGIFIAICLITLGIALFKNIENVLNRMINDKNPVIRGIGYVLFLIGALVLLYLIISYFR